MSLIWLKEQALRAPEGTPLRQNYEAALKEIEKLEKKLEKYEEKPETKVTTTKK